MPTKYMKKHFSWLWFPALSSLLLVSGCTGDGNANSSETSVKEVEVNDSEVSEKVADLTFACIEGEKDGKPMPITIIENPNHDETLSIIYWNPKNFSFGEEWTPEKRCQEVSKRFQTIYDRDGIEYITADKAHWVTTHSMNVICSVKYKDAECEEDDLLFTLESKDEPNKVLQELMAFREDPSSGKSLKRGTDKNENEEVKRIYFNLGERIDEFNSQATPKRESNSDSKSAF